ncbi:hypothetical protein ACP4OV_021413 [Aristida adscensionis]
MASTSWCTVFFSMLQKIRIGGLLCSAKQELKKDAWQHPHLSTIQPSANDPLFLQVVVGRREYSGNVEHDDLSFPVTSLQLKMQAIVESGTMDVVFGLDGGGKIILQLRFLLSDDDRKRIQEMRYSAMKRKQQELLGDGFEFNFPDSPLSKRLNEKISDIPSKGDVPKLPKSISLNDLQERAIDSGTKVDTGMKASRDLLVQSNDRDTSRSEDSNGSKKGHGRPKSGASSSVKKMISAFESSSSQGLTSDIGASLTELGRTQTEKELIIPLGDKGSNYRLGEDVLLQDGKSHASGRAGLSNASESQSRRSSGRDGTSRKNMRESRSNRRSQARLGPSIDTFSPKQVRSMGLSRSYLEHPLNYLVATSSTMIHPHVCVTTASRQLKVLLELEQLNLPPTYIKHTTKSLYVKEHMEEGTDDDGSTAPLLGGGFPVLNGWLINQGVRAAIVIIACGAMFLNNR